MKRYNNIFLAALFGATLLLGGCREEEKIADDLYIPGLGGEKYAENELDKWLYQNYTLPYNIDVVYRWDAAQAYSSLSEVQLVPVEFDAVQPMMAALRDVWFVPYIQATGNSQDFLKEVAPMKIVLVGSPEYQNGSYKLGQAEGGRKILLLNVNNFDASDENELKESLIAYAPNEANVSLRGDLPITVETTSRTFLLSCPSADDAYVLLLHSNGKVERVLKGPAAV